MAKRQHKGENALSASLSSGEECTESQRIRYYSKISGPLLDRIDIQIDVPKVEFKEMISKTQSETSAIIRTRVQRARKKQIKRFRSRNIYSNAQMGTREVKMFCLVGNEGKELLEMAVTKLGFSARTYTRVLKVARTIADLEGQENICTDHISEAIQYRMLDKYL